MNERLAATRALLERVVALIEPSQPGAGSIAEARNLIAEAGIARNAHVSDEPVDLGELETYEWILGQFADVIDSAGWFAMNSGLNVAHRYLNQYNTEVAP